MKVPTRVMHVHARVSTPGTWCQVQCLYHSWMLTNTCTHRYRSAPLFSQGFATYTEYPDIKEYMDRVRARDSWRHTLYPDSLVRSEWGSKLEQWGAKPSN